MEKARPTPAAVIPMIRTAKTSMTEKAMELKRFEVAVQAAMLRRYGLSTTQRRPSAISARKPGPGVPSAACRSGAGSGRRIHQRKSPDPRNERASRATANGAVTSPIRTPAIPGPTTWAPARLISSFAFPSWSWSRSTREGR